MRATVCDCVMALARIVGTVRRYRADLFVGRYLVEQLRQHRRIADMAPRYFNGPDLQCFLVDPHVDLASQASLRAAVLTRVPFAFPLGLDPGAVDQQVQRTR